MERATISAKDGAPYKILMNGQETIVGNTSLHQFLKSLEAEGWRVDGDLPRFTVEAEYEVRLVKDEALPRVTGSLDD